MGFIASASLHLQVLEISVRDNEKSKWYHDLMRATIPHLRVFHLMISGHGSRCAYVQAFLDRHPALTDLVLDLPMCCDTEGITLASTFPHLTSFALTAADLGCAPSDFLARHPALTRLRFSTYQAFTLPTVSLPHLRALCARTPCSTASL
ncbi:hypothetical protein FB451DRAFT_1397912 [Mycena latifolia]|nr:hypothetical protein FB451DRAFT_1397912 [Mycena latifolia]